MGEEQMESQMSNNIEQSPTSPETVKGKRKVGLSNWVIFVIVLVVIALLAAAWATYTFYPTYFPFGVRPRLQNVAGDFQFFYVAKTVISTMNIALLVFLLATHASIYAKTKSEFAIGLLIFSGVFLIKELAASPFIITAFGYILVGLGPFALVPDVLEFIALSVLLYFSVIY